MSKVTIEQASVRVLECLITHKEVKDKALANSEDKFILWSSHEAWGIFCNIFDLANNNNLEVFEKLCNEAYASNTMLSPSGSPTIRSICKKAYYIVRSSS